MSHAFCSFCTHRNPAEAKFCNQCGSPLGLKPCPDCEAVNDVSAVQCHQCGAALEMPPGGQTAESDAVPASETVEAVGDALPASEAVEAVDDARPVSEMVEAVRDAPPVSETVEAVGDALPAGETVSAVLDARAEGAAVHAAPAADVHIPESFADRLERESEMHAGHRIEPRTEASRSPAFAEHEEKDRPPLRVDRRRMPDRSHAWRAPLVFAVLFVVGGAGYYAYTNPASDIRRLGELALAGLRSDEAPPAQIGAGPATPDEASGPMTADRPAESPATASRAGNPLAGAAGNPAASTPDAAQPSSSNPAAAALVGVQPGAPGTPANETTSPQAPATQDASTTARPSASAKRNDDAVARQKTETASRPRRPANADAIATQRLIERDLGTLSSSPSRAPDAPLDRDALATQRLIERDLGPFLHRNDRGATGRTYPAIN